MYQSQNTQPNVLYVDDLQTNLILFQATFEREYISSSPNLQQRLWRS